MRKRRKENKTLKKKTNITKKQEEKKLSVKEELIVVKDKNLRLIAEFDNFRKRNAKERIELFSTAGQDIMTSLLPILDDLERAIKSNNYDDQHGIYLIFNKLKSELQAKGLKEMENPIGRKLDTEFHEAISNIPASKKKEKGKIIEIIEKGYFLGEKVIRYAKVVVAS
jgi:molecular chaperone GrpE